MPIYRIGEKCLKCSKKEAFKIAETYKINEIFIEKKHFHWRYSVSDKTWILAVGNYKNMQRINYL